MGPANARPMIVANPNSMIRAIFPPFPFEFLVAIETIPPANKKIATNTPAEPPTSPLSDNVLLIPAAHD